MVAYVGMNPANDVNWLVAGTIENYLTS